MVAGFWYSNSMTYDDNTTAAATNGEWATNGTAVDGYVVIHNPPSKEDFIDKPLPIELHWDWELVDLIYNPTAKSPFPFVERRPLRGPFISRIAHPRPPPLHGCAKLHHR